MNEHKRDEEKERRLEYNKNRVVLKLYKIVFQPFWRHLQVNGISKEAWIAKICVNTRYNRAIAMTTLI